MRPVRYRHCNHQGGFTLTETLTSVCIFALVGAALVSLSVNTSSSVGYQNNLVDTQMDLSTAMALLRSDLVAAGYLPEGLTEDVFQQVTTGTTSDSITFLGDVNSDNVSERITYAVLNGQLMRTQDVWSGGGWTAGTAQPVADDVTAFTLQFYVSCPFQLVVAPTPQPTPQSPALQSAADVMAGQTSLVRITLTAISTYKDKTITKTLTSQVAERESNVRPTC